MRKNEKRLRKNILGGMLLLIAIIMLVMGLVSIGECIGEIEPYKETAFTYERASNTSYNYNLVDNDIYNENVGNNIISKYINTIDVKYVYEFNASKRLEYQLKYDINLYLVHEEKKTNKELYKEPIVISKDKKVEDKNQSGKIEEVVTIDYNLYNSKAQAFKDNSGIETNSYLVVEFVMNDSYRDAKEDAKLANTKVSRVRIPLLENVVTIENEAPFYEANDYKVSRTKDFNYIVFAAGVTMVVIAGIYVYFSVKMLSNYTCEVNYNEEKENILRKYGDVIAETSTKPDLNHKNILDITNFTDLVDIEDELRIPIILYETAKDREAWFVILCDDKAYRYVLKGVEKE